MELESRVSVSNTTFSSCSASDGGAIAIATTLSISTFSNLTFNYCVANTNGGGIFATLEAIIEVIDSHFSKCEAGTLGAGIAAEATTFIVATRCSFFAGSASLSGGGIGMTGSATLSATSCLFMENTAGLHGGAVYLTAQTSARIDDNHLTGNAAHRGGAIWADDLVDMEVYASTFSNNFALLDAGAAGWSDGATVTLSSCEVMGNVAHFRGGGIMLEVSAGGLISNTHFSVGPFSPPLAPETGSTDDGQHNTASRGMGGAMMLTSAGKFLSISNCTFENNRASQGGGLALAYCSLDVAFVENVLSSNTAYAQGGAFYLVSGQLDVSSCSFMGNSANNGGTAFLSRNGVVAISNSLIGYEAVCHGPQGCGGRY